MGMIVPAVPMASAAMVFFGSPGSVTLYARQRGVSRQRIYRESSAVVAAVEGTAQQRQVEAPCVTRSPRCGVNSPMASQRLAQTVQIDTDQQAKFACIAQAEGVSLAVARRLLAVFLAEQTPSVATLGRWTQAVGDKAGALLTILDEVSKTAVRQAVTDENYVGGKPVLMVVEPESLCWQHGRLAEHADGASWAEALRPLTALEQVTRDAGSGMAKGVHQLNAERQTQGRTPLGDQLDHFHTLREGHRALRRQQQRAQHALAQAEEAEKRWQEARRQGRSQAGLATRQRPSVGERQNAVWTPGSTKSGSGGRCSRQCAYVRQRES